MKGPGLAVAGLAVADGAPLRREGSPLCGLLDAPLCGLTSGSSHRILANTAKAYSRVCGIYVIQAHEIWALRPRGAFPAPAFAARPKALHAVSTAPPQGLIPHRGSRCKQGRTERRLNLGSSFLNADSDQQPH